MIADCNWKSNKRFQSAGGQQSPQSLRLSFGWITKHGWYLSIPGFWIRFYGSGHASAPSYAFAQITNRLFVFIWWLRVLIIREMVFQNRPGRSRWAELRWEPAYLKRSVVLWWCLEPIFRCLLICFSSLCWSPPPVGTALNSSASVVDPLRLCLTTNAWLGLRC